MTARSRPQDENQHHEDEKEPLSGTVAARPTWGRGVHLRHIRQFTAEALRDRLQASHNTARHIARAEPRHDDLVDDPPRHRIGNFSLKPLADLDAQLAVLHGQKQKQAIIACLVAKLPCVDDTNREAFDR